MAESSADSAGVPWEGRQFQPSTASSDDGSAPVHLMAALRAYRVGDLGEAGVIDALRDSRLLIPLVARRGESGENRQGVTVDKRAELSIVTVAGPDGRNVMPVFSSADAMRLWNPTARPVPADAIRVAVAAADEDTELVIIDAKSESEFVLRRPALWALARSEPWQPSYLDTEVLAAFVTATDAEPDVRSLSLEAGDPLGRLTGPELVVTLALVPGLTRVDLDALLTRLQRCWTEAETIARRVDSLTIRITTANR